MADRPRIHQVCCTLISGPEGTVTFGRAAAIAEKVERYARKLGMAVMHEDVDEADEQDSVSPILEASDG